MEPYVFYISAFLTIFSVVMMILRVNPIASAIWLVASFFSLAVVYVTLSAHFVAALQILVYAGAVMVLFVFVIMLLNLRDDELVYDKLNWQRVLVFFLGFGLFAFLAQKFTKLPPVPFAKLAPDFGSVEFVAKSLLGEYVIAFELMSVLLLVGLVGAIVLGRREE